MGDRTVTQYNAGAIAQYRVPHLSEVVDMQLHISKPPMAQSDDAASSLVHTSTRISQRHPSWIASPPSIRNPANKQNPQPIRRQLAQANQFGHHLRQFQPYSQAGYGIQLKSAQSGMAPDQEYRWRLHRYPDRSAHESQKMQPAAESPAPMQPSDQPVQFIFGWVLRKMVRSTLGWLFPRPKA